MCFLVVTGGLYRRLETRTGKPRLSSFLMTLAVAIAVVAPLRLVGGSPAGEATSIASLSPPETAATPAAGGGAPAPAPCSDAEAGAPPSEAAAADAWNRFFASHGRIRAWRDDVDRWLGSFGTDTKSIRDQALHAIGRPFAFGALRTIFETLFGFVVMLATLYFLYRDHGKIRALVIDLSPMPLEQTTRVLDVLRDTAFAAVVGGLATAIIQGILGGIAFAITGVAGPVFWGAVMAVFALLPVGGTAFVWAPVGIYFLLQGESTWKGWFILGYGVGVIGMADNLLRPWLMRRAGAGEVHPLLLFFAVISGIGLFGFSGVVFGPLLVAFVLVVVQIFREHFGRRAATLAVPGASPPAGAPPPPPQPPA